MVCLKLSLVALNLTLFSLPLGESLWVLSGDWEMSAAPFLPRLWPAVGMQIGVIVCLPGDQTGWFVVPASSWLRQAGRRDGVGRAHACRFPFANFRNPAVIFC